MNIDQSGLLGQEIVPVNVPNSDEKILALLSHALTMVAWFIAPLIIYLLKKDESSFVAEHAKESLNFQITMFICYAVSFILIILLIGIVFIWLLGILNLVFVIVACIKAFEGKIFRYPFCIRLIK